MLVAPAARDRLAAGVDVAERLENGLADDWRRLGLELLDARPATDEDLAARPLDMGEAPAAARRRSARGRRAHRPSAPAAARGRRSALISSGHVRRPRTVRRHGAADPDR